MIREALDVGRTEGKKGQNLLLLEILSADIETENVSHHRDGFGKSSSSSSKQVMWKKWKLTRKHKIVWAVCCFLRVWNGSEWRWSGRKRGEKIEKSHREMREWWGWGYKMEKYCSLACQLFYTAPNPHLLCVTPMSTALEPSSSCHRQLPYLQDDNDDDELFSNTRTRWHFLSFALQVHKCVFHFPLSNFASLSLNSHPLLQPNPIWSFIVTSLRHFSGVVSWWCKWESIRNGGKNVRTSFWTFQLSLSLDDSRHLSYYESKAGVKGGWVTINRLLNNWKQFFILRLIAEARDTLPLFFSNNPPRILYRYFSRFLPHCACRGSWKTKYILIRFQQVSAVLIMLREHEKKNNKSKSWTKHSS